MATCRKSHRWSWSSSQQSHSQRAAKWFPVPRKLPSQAWHLEYLRWRAWNLWSLWPRKEIEHSLKFPNRIQIPSKSNILYNGRSIYRQVRILARGMRPRIFSRRLQLSHAIAVVVFQRSNVPFPNNKKKKQENKTRQNRNRTTTTTLTSSCKAPSSTPREWRVVLLDRQQKNSNKHRRTILLNKRVCDRRFFTVLLVPPRSSRQLCFVLRQWSIVP